MNGEELKKEGEAAVRHESAEDRGAKKVIEIDINPIYKYLLLWGYVAALATTVQFLTLRTITVEGGVKSWVVWIVAGGLGLLISAKFLNDDRRRGNFKEIKSSPLLTIWGGFIAAVLLIIILWGNSFAGLIYPVTALVFTYALHMTTRLLGERWIYMGVAACAVFVVVFKFIDHLYFPLLMAAIILLGNIMPIHILISEEINRNKIER